MHMRFLLRWPLAIALLPGTACLAAHAHHPDSEHIAAPDSAVPALGASAAFDSAGRLWVATTQGGHVQLRHSDDLGKTFSIAVPVNPTAERIDARGENRPELKVSADGVIHVVWTHPLERHWTSAVRYARSTDGGRSFAPPRTLGGEEPDASRGFAALALTGSGGPVVAWIDNGSVDAAKTGKHHARIVYTWSDDAGKTFAPPRGLPGDSCECCRIALARQADGAAIALYRGVFGDDIRDHSLAVLPTHAEPLHATRVTFSGWRIAACPEQGPALAVGAGRSLHALWYEASHGPAIWYGRLDPGHAPRDALRIGARGASHADVAAHDSHVWIAWNQVDAKGYALMVRTSDDGGRRFGPPRELARTADAVDSPQLLLRGSRAYATWNTSGGFRVFALPSVPAAP